MSMHKELSAADLMPRTEQEMRILRERAAHLAMPEFEKKQSSEECPYVCFRLGSKEKYGVPYDSTREIISYTPPTPVPLTTEAISGVVNHRGALLTVIDLKKMFHIQETLTEYSHILFTKSNKVTVGILVNSLDGLSSYEPATLDPFVQSEQIIKANYILGVHQGVIPIINIDAIIADIF